MKIITKTLSFFIVCMLASLSVAQISGAGQLGCNATPVTGTAWNSSTSINTTQVLATNVTGAQIIVTLDQTTTLTAGVITFQGDPGDGNLVTLNTWQVVDVTTAPFATITNPYTLVASTNKQFLILMGSYYKLQLKLSTAITGTGSITPFTVIACYQLPLSYQATNANLNASVTFPSAQAVNNTQQGTASQNIQQVLGATLSATNTLFTQMSDGTTVMGAMANYGTSPGAVKAINANAFVTNTVATNITQTAGATLSATNPLFTEITDGTNAMGAQANFGTSPTAVKSLNANVSLFYGTTVASNTTAGIPDTNLKNIGNSAVVTATTGVQKVGIVGNAGAIIDAATGAAPPANTIFIGGIKSGATGGFVSGITVCDLDAVVNISTATTTLTVTGVASRQVRICSINLLAAAADNVALIEGTGATCGTGTAGMAGGTTAASGWNFAANGGLTQGSGLGEVMTTATSGDSVCLVTSAATQLSGHIKYTIF